MIDKASFFKEERFSARQEKQAVSQDHEGKECGRRR
jgi:hypothetical protein